VTGLEYGLAAQLYVVANVVLALGYLFVPVLLVPYLEVSRRTMVAMAVFFVGCTGSHSDMVWDVLSGHDRHPAVGWVAVWWHVIQAVGTWAAILFFRSDLKAANDLIERVDGGPA